MFYIYDQNNSGGGFDRDDDVACTVIIEADSAEEADARAEDVGIYFDGTDDDGPDCPCCGDRWSRAWGDGKDTPQIHGKDIAHVYYKDGTKRSYTREGAA